MIFFTENLKIPHIHRNNKCNNTIGNRAKKSFVLVYVNNESAEEILHKE